MKKISKNRNNTLKNKKAKKKKIIGYIRSQYNDLPYQIIYNDGSTKWKYPRNIIEI